MIENKISATIDQVTLDKIITLLNDAYVLIPSMTTLSVQQRKESFKMGDGSAVFAKDSYNEAKGNSILKPPFVELDEMKNDLDYDAALKEIEFKVIMISERLSDTRMVVGSEAMNAALAIYNYIKQCVVQNIPGSKSAYDNLKKRFIYKKHDEVNPAQ
jgi:hypothetical protein